MKKIMFHVIGIPPHKDLGRSIRNKLHPNHDRFLQLRKVAKKAMGKRKYHEGPVSISMRYIRAQGEKSISDYISGICDTLDGSHGFTFHWPPIVFLDDCQVEKIAIKQEVGKKDEYFLEIDLL